MNELDIQKILDMNYRCLMLLGYSMALLHGTSLSPLDDEKHAWLKKAVENIIYFDKPLPPCP